MMTVTIVSKLMAAVVPKIASQTAGTDLVSNLLTGGGFMFLAAIMGGLALWNKNQSESIASINKASQEFVEGARAEVAAARAEALAFRVAVAEARIEAAAARRELEEVQDSAEADRRKLRRWMRQQKNATDDHKIWDDELKTEMERLGGIIREAPPLSPCSPDDPNFPTI